MLQDFSFFFLSILIEGAPFILLGTLLSGFIDVYLPPGAMEKLLPRHKGAAVMVAGLLGAILPVCECAVVPVIRKLLGKGLPFACALTYMLAAPIINPITFLSTYKAFGGATEGVFVDGLFITMSRMFLGYAVAVFAGLLVMRMPLEWLLRPSVLGRVSSSKLEVSSSGEEGGGCGHDHGHSHECGHDHVHSEECGHDHGHDHHHHHGEAASGLVRAMRAALKDFVDVAVYFVIGVAITAIFNVYVGPDSTALKSIADGEISGTATMMGLAFILSLCSTSDAFVAATLGYFTNGAKLAFLIFGPMMDVKLIFLYQTVLRKKAIFWLAVGLFLTIGIVTIAWQRAMLLP